MTRHNATIAAIFSEIADLLDIQAANPFRIRAYRNASHIIGNLGVDVVTMTQRGKPLTDLPGIGDDLEGKIEEILQTGHCQLLDRLRAQIPPAVAEMLRVEGLGPKRVRALWHELEVQSLEQLLRAAQDGRIRNLPGFGERTERKILDAVRTRLGHVQRFKLAVAAQYAQAYVTYLNQSPGVRHIEVAGSFRRMRETVGDLDMLVAADPDSPVIDRFIHYDQVKEVRASGPARGTVILANNLQVDIRVISPASFGAALQYFTGSKTHNIALRRIAQERGLKLNEYGLFKGSNSIAGITEESIYHALGLEWIPPELREDRGEIEAAHAHTLPKLVALTDLRGDLHAHSKASDGHHSIREMAAAAQEQGLEYLAITEHSQRLAMARGLDCVGVAKQCEEIDRINTELHGVTVLKGIEVDILDDGNLDLPDTTLAALDLVVVAIHSKFNLSREQQTSRILTAFDNPHARILAHPTGRLIDQRDAYDVDMRKIIRKAKEKQIALELNAHPLRLDLLDTYCRMAKDEGVAIAINSDSHSVFDFDMLKYGVGQARRGWLEQRDVLNTRGLLDLRRWLKRVPDMHQ